MWKRLVALAMSVVLITTGIDMTAFAAEQNENVLKEANVESGIGTPEVTGSNAVGTILANALSQEQEEQAEDNGNCIMTVEMDGKTAKVSYVTMEPSTIVVGIYDNEGQQLLGTGTTEVSSDVRETTVTIDVEEMPEYFYVKGFLIESDSLKPLCSVYENPNYTKEMQEFFAKTTDDFDEEKVYNLDDDKTNNFLVYGEDVEQIAAQSNINKLVSADDENKVYVFENIDSSISALAIGDIFTYGEENPYIIKVGNISIDGTTATITGAETKMEDVFDFVKIDTTCEIVLPEEESGEEEVQSYGVSGYGMPNYSTLGWGIEIDEGLEVTKDAISKDFCEKELPGGVELKGTFELTPGMGIKIYHDDYTYVELTVSLEVALSVSLSKEWSGEVPIADVPLSAIGVILVTLPVYFVIEVEGSVSFGGTLSAELGFSYHSENGAKWIKPTPEISIEAAIEVSVFVGIRAAMQVSVLKIISIEYNVDVGAELGASYSKEFYSNEEEEDIQHACKHCIDGDISAKLKMGWIFRVFGEEEDSDVLAEISIKVGDFYYSIDNNEFGLGECPNLEYKTTLRFLNGDNKPVEGVLINDKDVSDENGQVQYYLKSGTHQYKLQKAGFEEKNIIILVSEAPSLKTVYLGYKGIEEDDYLGEEDDIEGDNPEDASGDGDDEETDHSKNGWTQLSLGSYTSGAVDSDGNLYMWGSNSNGQLGTGVTGDSAVPTKVLENVEKVGLWSLLSRALTKDGTLYTWGSSSYGHFGATYTSSLIPIKILENVIDFEDGFYIGAAITEDRSLYMWGRNNFGQLGNGTIINSATPIKILDDVVSVSMFQGHSGAITSDGSLYMWGENTYGQLGNGSNTNSATPIKVLDDVDSVVLGYGRSAAVTKDGKLYMWGYNQAGRLGDGTNEDQYSPVLIMENVDKVALGEYHSGAITKDGKLYMWGHNLNGELGDGTFTDQYSPVLIMENVEKLSLTRTHSGAITKDGKLYMWGDNYNGDLGDGTSKTDVNSPVLIMENVEDVILENTHNGAITKDGNIYMWGYNNFGQLGIGTSSSVWITTPQKISDVTNRQNDITDQNVLSVNLQVNHVSTIQNTNNDEGDGSLDGADGTTDGDGEKEEETDSTPTPSTADFTGKIPGETYNFYVMKTRTGEGDASPSNILYLDQVVADVDGNVSVSYIPRENCDEAKIFLSGRMGKFDFANAVVTAKDQLYTGEELFADVTVTYEGKELTEGIDYELCGSYSATKPGEYTLTVKGMGEYKGVQTVSYHVRRYSLDVFGVIFDSNGGTAVETREVEAGQPVTEPEAPTRENHHFKGWYLNGELYDFNTPVNSNIELVAEWEEFSQLAAPKASIPSGSRVNAGKDVSFTTDEPEAVIYYTLDGTLPTTESPVYSTPIVLERDVTIRAVAVKEGYYDSSVSVYEYTVIENGDAFDTVAPEDVPEEGIPEGIWVGRIADRIYTGKAVRPEVRVYDGTKRLVAGRDYTISYKNNVKAQTDLTSKKVPTVIVKGKGNYSMTLTVPFVIQPLDLNSETITVDDVTMSYKGTMQTKTPTVYYGTKKLSKKDVMVTFTDTSEGAYKELGTYEVKLTGTGNFSGERIVNLTVTDKILMSSVNVAKVAAQPYREDGDNEPTLDVTYQKNPLTKGTDYEVAYINNKEIGTATAILTGKGTYAGIKRVTFKITGTNIKKVKIDGITDTVYTGDAITRNLTLIHNGVPLSEDSYTVEYANNTNVGTATVTITGKGAFTGTVKKKFKITPYDLKADTENVVDDVGQNFEVLYEKGGSKPAVAVVYKGQNLMAGKDYTISYKNNNAVTTEETKKTPTFTIKGKGNFKGTLTGSFKILTKALDDAAAPVTITVNDIAYTGRAGNYISNPVLTDSNDKVLKAGIDYEKDIVYTLKDGTLLDKTSVVGIQEEVVVTVTGKGNYTKTLTAAYKVTELDFKKVKIKVEPQTYTGEAISLTKEDVEITLSGLPLTFGEDYEVVEGSYKNNLRKGTASVTIKGKGSYGGSKTVKFKVMAKELKK